MTYSTQFQDFSINDTPQSSNPAYCPRICNGRTFKYTDIAFDAVQVALIALVAYGVFATYLNPSENNDLIFDFCIGEIAVNLSLAVISEIFFCMQGCKKNKRKMVNPLILLTAVMFGGALATEVSYALAERTVKQHPFVDFSDVELIDLAHAQDVLKQAPVKEMWMAAPAAGFLTLGYEILLRHLKKNHERKPLLEV